MIEKLNHRIPGFLLNPDDKVHRHLLVQVVVLFITMNILWDEPDKILTDRLTAWVLYFLQINIVIYVNMYLLVPKLLAKGRTLYYFLSLPLLIICSVFSIGLLQPSIDNAENNPSFLESIASLTAFSLFIVGLTTIQLFSYRLGNIRKIDELKNATMTIELANLQNQINPHFLFNILNNANIMAGEDVEKSSFILSKLNGLLQYQIEEGSQKMIRLKDDIIFISDYLELEKLRRDRFFYEIDSAGNNDIEIPPLLFIPFVENAVKHNPENDSYVKIIFRVSGNRLYFECKNPKAKLPRTRTEGGIGLVNIKKRLDLLFEGNYHLSLKDEEELYTVNMEFKI